MAADVRGGGRVHGGDVADELLVDVVQFADTSLGRVDEGDVRGEWGESSIRLRPTLGWGLVGLQRIPHCWRALSSLAEILRL